MQREDIGEADRLEKMLHRTEKLPELGKVALWYAKQGWPVFPLFPGSKKPAISKLSGGHGVLDATTDLNQIHAWWKANPSFNIGLATGVVFDVIDVDGPEGIQSLANLPGGKIPDDIHGQVDTPRGFHFYVLPSGQGNKAGFFPGIDYRGRGGYVVAPPSQIDFKRYSWIVKPSPRLRQRAAAPPAAMEEKR